MKNSARLPQRGFSLVETMVGIAIALIIIAGVLAMFSQYLGANRRLALDARLQQDLRVASEIVARDLRRAGYWRGALDATLLPTRSAPHGSIALTGSSSATQVNYSYTGNKDGLPKDDAADSNNAGFRVNGETIEMKEGDSGWQDVTDPNSVRVTAFSITANLREVTLGGLCWPVCTSATPQCPTLQVRSFDIALRARSASDPSTVREARQSVHVRNDDISAATCPSTP